MKTWFISRLQPSDEDEETRNYRLEIEKQKQLREKIMRDKELKRRRAAEEKLHEVSLFDLFNRVNTLAVSRTESQVELLFLSSLPA